MVQASNRPGLIEIISEKLPPIFEELDLKHIKIEFKQLSRHFEMPNCGKEIRDVKRTIYGMVRSTKGRTIYLHSGFKDLVEGKRAAHTYNCGHRNEQKLLEATVIHELTHLVDQKQKITSTKNYKRFTANKTQFLPLLPGLKIRNIKSHRSPDSYEFFNDREHLAVNTEFFLLDPNFKCSRPATYDLLNRIYDFTPYEKECGRAVVLLNEGAGVIKSINPGRLYAIHYLQASAGKKMESRFGHAMYRLVFCAPRTTYGEKCLKDVSEHVVVSYAANQTRSGVLNAAAGLFGGYTMNLFLLPLSEVIKDYNYDEGRDLNSYEISFTQKQKNVFLSKVLEEHWTYFGKYLFFTNNCASESARVLNLASNQDSGPIHFPNAIQKELLASGRINKMPTQVFPEKMTALKTVMAKLEAYEASVYQAVEQVSISEGELDDFIHQIKNLHKEDSIKVLGGYVSWITHLINQKEKKMDAVALEDITKMLKEKNISDEDLSSFRLVNYEYGVPTRDQVEAYSSVKLEKLKAALSNNIRGTTDYTDRTELLKIKDKFINSL